MAFVCPFWSLTVPAHHQQLAHFAEYLLLCSTEDRISYRFGTTWGRANKGFSILDKMSYSVTRDSSPKNEDLVIIYSRSSCSKPVWPQMKIFWRMMATKQLIVIQWGGGGGGIQWLPSTIWLPTFFKISSFVFNWNKETNTCLEQLEGE